MFRTDIQGRNQAQPGGVRIEPYRRRPTLNPNSSWGRGLDTSSHSSSSLASISSNSDHDIQHRLQLQILSPVATRRPDLSPADFKKMKRADRLPLVEVFYRSTLAVTGSNRIVNGVMGTPSGFEGFLEAGKDLPIIDAVVRGISGIVMAFYAKARVVGGDWKNRVLKIIDGTRAGLAFAYLISMLGAVISAGQGALSVSKVFFSMCFGFVAAGLGLTLIKDSFELALSYQDRSNNRKVINRVDRPVRRGSERTSPESDYYRSSALTALIARDKAFATKIKAYKRLSVGSLLMLLGLVSGVTWIPGLIFTVWGASIRLKQALRQTAIKQNQRRAHKIRAGIGTIQDDQLLTENRANAVNLLVKSLQRLPGGKLGKWTRFKRAVGTPLGEFRYWLYHGDLYQSSTYKSHLKINALIAEIRNPATTVTRLQAIMDETDKAACSILGAEKIEVSPGVYSYRHDARVNPKGFADELVRRWLASGQDDRQSFRLICDILGPQKVQKIFVELDGALYFNQKFARLVAKRTKQSVDDLSPESITAFAEKYLIRQVGKRLA